MDDLAEFADLALDAARAAGATYADCRVVERRTQLLSVKNARVGDLNEAEELGIGIRVFTGGALGFAATHDLSAAAIRRTAARAAAIARASALCPPAHPSFADEPPAVASWATTFAIDPFRIPLSEKIDHLLRVDAAIHSVKGITSGEATLNLLRETKLFVSTAGARIRQERTHTGAGCKAGAFRDGELQERSYPAAFGGQFQARGWELVEELRMAEHAPRLAEEAVALLSAPPCPAGETDLLLESSQVALQVHESVGHPIELDRVLGSEANFAGTSFLAPGDIGSLRYGSEAMNIVADATPAHGPSIASFAFDDEGVAAQRNEIVRAGRFAGFMTSRETAAAVGAARSNGCMRAESWARIPLIRMTNVSLLPGTWRFDDLVGDTQDGIYMSTVRSWSIDDRRLDFQFGPEIAWEIKGGKRGRMFKNPTYGGITPVFWGKLDAVCGPADWTLWGIPNCGKGQPGQTIGVGHGAAPARWRKVRVGAAGR
ncbi:MAG: TldD/PmbA family protein [Planctomycetes bacterium]|nr:TldD/PmbA family protein [Planctomycetota bacterium]